MMLPLKEKRLLLSDFDYTLPADLIAQQPIEPRDHSRLLVVHRETQQLEHKHFFDIVDYLVPGDVLVINTSKVIKARLHGTKPTGGKVEVLLLRQIDIKQWECLVRGKVNIGWQLTFSDHFTGQVIQQIANGEWQIAFNKKNITSIGTVPLPPYIRTNQPLERYQTVYAEQTGSVAAPTAGLHFTDALLQKLKDKGVVIVPVILHVGLGTFASVKTEDITQHQMHAEYAVL